MHDDAARTCPACGSTLVPVQHEGASLDRCPNDCGLWLDRGELGHVAAAEGADRSTAEEDAALASGRADGVRALVEEAASTPRRACPVCRRPMLLVEYPGSGVPMDECGEHGTWLDAGELERIEAFAEGMRRGIDAAPATVVAGLTLPPGLLDVARGHIDPPP
ncbi:MAG: hypothetical protein JWM98_1364 [Thermoleophilia bacterium]|nr:hypothetical protein [Thermoleophilia bacterium]